MVHAFNALLECLVTALFTAGILALFPYVGLLPIVVMAVTDVDDVMDDENDDKEEE